MTPETASNTLILEAFKRHGNNASYHFADDSSGEWRLGYDEQRKAVEMFDTYPGLRPAMREIAKGFLWTLEPR